MDALVFVRGNNIQRQIEQCTTYAEKKGYNIKIVAIGQGNELPDIISGLNTYIDLVLVADMSRISRNALENYTIQVELDRDYGVKIEDTTGITINHEQEMLFMQNVIKAVQEHCSMYESVRRRIRQSKIDK